MSELYVSKTVHTKAQQLTTLHLNYIAEKMYFEQRTPIHQGLSAESWLETLKKSPAAIAYNKKYEENLTKWLKESVEHAEKGQKHFIQTEAQQQSALEQRQQEFLQRQIERFEKPTAAFHASNYIKGELEGCRSFTEEEASQLIEKNKKATQLLKGILPDIFLDWREPFTEMHIINKKEQRTPEDIKRLVVLKKQVDEADNVIQRHKQHQQQSAGSGKIAYQAMEESMENRVGPMRTPSLKKPTGLSAA